MANSFSCDSRINIKDKGMDAKNNDKMLIYQSEDGEIKIDVRLLAIPI